MEEVNNVSENEICCHFRHSNFYIGMALVFHLFCLCLLLQIILFENSLAWYMLLILPITALCVLIYLILQCINKKVILTDEIITFYDVLGRKKEYDLTEVTQIVFNSRHVKGGMRTWIVIKFNNKKKESILKGCNFSKLESKLAKIFGLKGYSRYGGIKFDV